MPAFIKQTNTSIGFGVTREEAENDAYINACTVDLSNDKEKRFISRRTELHPWMPLSNMLHISGVGCLVYENRKIRETASGKTIVVAATGNAIFRYMSILFGERLSYTDIVCVLREEIDTFFANISNEFVPIGQMPIIQTQRESAGFIPNVLYKTNAGFVIGCVNNYVGIRHIGEDCFYVTEVNKSVEQLDAIYRLLYRTGKVLVDDEVREL